MKSFLYKFISSKDNFLYATANIRKPSFEYFSKESFKFGFTNLFIKLLSSNLSKMTLSAPFIKRYISS